jgi:signal transduction histidine kinase
MVRRSSVQLMILFYGFVAWLLVLVAPCIAQETANLGIFSATIDFGIEPFSKKIGNYKVPGRVEISGSGDDLIYDLYGNGMNAHQPELFQIQTSRSGSWQFSGKLKWIDRGGEGGAPIVALRLEDKVSRFNAFLVQPKNYPNGASLDASWGKPPQTYSLAAQNLSNEIDYDIPQIDDGVYLRITRITPLNWVASEWSMDGIEWKILWNTSLKMEENVQYCVWINNDADNEQLAHAQLSQVTLEPVSCFAERFVSSTQYKPKDDIHITLYVKNLSGTVKTVSINEKTPDGWSVFDISNGGIFTDEKISWSVSIKPGVTVLEYTLHVPDSPSYNAEFIGHVDSIITAGIEELNQSGFNIYQSGFKNDLVYSTFSIAVSLTIMVLYFSIFLFYPRFKSNLYFVFFLFFGFFYKFFTFRLKYPTEKFDSILSGYLILFSMLGVSASLLLFFYSIHYKKIPRRYWGFLAICILGGLVVWYSRLTSYPIYLTLLIFTLLLFESIRVLTVLWLNKTPGIWILVFGALYYVLHSLWKIISVFGWAPAPSEFSGTYAFLLFLSSMAIYLAYQFTQTSKELLTLNVELEDRVASRTSELEQANQELRELDKMKTQFVSQASHDLRTPLTAIKGSLDNLLMGIAGALNEKQQKVMTRATTSVDRLTNLINDVLDLNRIETGRIVLEKSDIPFKALVDNIIKENQPAADQKQITLNANLGDEITLHIDSSKVERVVGELISNAIKYTPDNGTVDVGLSCEGDSVSLSVNDSGIGMTPEECGKIWERFYRTSASKKFAKGSGLGLSIAKELVELHNGTLSVTSEYNQGTMFVMTLPLHNK